MTETLFDAAPVLRGLKDFQRRAVEHAFKRLYKAKHPSRRFLIADEVGLGKTLVARGIVAKTIEHLQRLPENGRINIVYICSNAAIAQQNVNRLNVLGLPECTLATRLTLLPIVLSDLGEQPINFVSFTPGTTFDLKSSSGRSEERRLLYKVLRRFPYLGNRGLMNLLRCDVRVDRWQRMLQETLRFDERIILDFLTAVSRDRELVAKLVDLCQLFRRDCAGESVELRKRRNVVVGQLRRLLAKRCAKALEPDLIILDEFQRFKDLLAEDTEAGELAHDLIDYPDARVLLLSATPYRMLSLYDEEAEDHYEDFIATLRFLFNDEAAIRRIERDLRQYRQALYEDAPDAKEVRDRLRSRLMQVMSRTERIGHTRKRDAMVVEPTVSGTLDPADLHRAAALDGVVRAVGAKEALEYWKSAPYLLNFMKGYELKVKIDRARENGVVASALDAMKPHLVHRRAIRRYEAIDPGNARMRALIDYTLGRDEWRLIWMPPSLPYTRSGPLFQGADPITKSIVFSSWNVVPDVIAAVCSYTVERQRVLKRGKTDYFELTSTRKPLLTFRLGEGRPEAMSTLTLMYPSVFLSRTIDPLGEALNQPDRLMTPDELRARY